MSTSLVIMNNQQIEYQSRYIKIIFKIHVGENKISIST